MRKLLEEIIAQCDANGGPTGTGVEHYKKAKSLLENWVDETEVVDFLWQLVDRHAALKRNEESEALFQKIISVLPSQRGLL